MVASAAPEDTHMRLETPGIHPLAALLRGFAIDFLTCHNSAVVERIMTPDYRLAIGGVVFDGRDAEYLPATVAQLEQFPGLCVTVHDVVIADSAIAMCFTEHGASKDDAGKQAAWSGITLFRTEGSRLALGWAEEEYICRKRQLFTGQCDPVEPPQLSPWDTQPGPKNPQAEMVAERWITEHRPVHDLPANGRLSTLDANPATLVDIRSAKINTLFSSGNRVALHAEYHGIYAGGFGDLSPLLTGCPAVLRLAAILTVDDGEVTRARITTDRLGLSRALRGML